jgi:hypothetical protein
MSIVAQIDCAGRFRGNGKVARSSGVPSDAIPDMSPNLGRF